jgi:N utilization substance protein B
MSRKKARDNAFKCVYELEFGRDENIEKILENCYEENDNKPDEKEYIEMVLKGIKENLAEIDSIILSKLKNWSFDRIAKIDLAILRLAIYEIKYIDDIPEKVSANEAVELAKTYGNNDSKSFVNGVIAKVIESKEEKNGTEENI